MKKMQALLISFLCNFSIIFSGGGSGRLVSGVQGLTGRYQR